MRLLRALRLHRRLALLGMALVVTAIAAAWISLSAGSANSGSDAAATVYRAKPSQLVDPRTPGRVRFVSDFERGDFPEWYVQALPGRARLVSSSPFEGDANAQFEVRPGDVEPDTGSQRAEVSGPTYHEGQDIYVRTAFRVPKSNTFRGPWQLIQQFHEADGWGGSPGTAVFLTSDRRLKFGHGDSSQIDWISEPLQADRWYTLVYRVKFSRDPEVGFVEVWFEGEHQRLRSGRYREYGFTMQEPHSYLKTGIYRSQESRGVSVMEDDSVIVVERRD